ncbi:dentin sialophosphoprotein isoform X2 [Phymastichus coffea]|uniref:dentin sialophosphoprotein isoform X2 n=1 Tax=Phymastichus coffea TaxID=108790 RepID=UPI00273AEC46|nr:dentin sialophosphoprotein isoform X2 [Phymastichus coffea]
MMMDAVKIGTVPTTKPLLINKIIETTDSSKEKIDDISFTEDNEDDEMRLRLSDEEENEQDNIFSNIQNHQPNSLLKKDDFELDASTTVNSEETSEVCQEKLKNTDTSDKKVNTPSTVDSKDSSKVCQQISKGSETSVKQTDTLAPVDNENKSGACQQRLIDSEESTEKENCKSIQPEEASINLEQVVKYLDSAIEEGDYTNYPSDGDLDEERVTENGNLSDEETGMSDRMPHNPTKYWSSFDPRPWKGSRKRSSFPHRGSNSWYHQQYPDRDKLKKNNLHHSNSHFIRTSRSRGSFSSSARESWTRDAKKDEVNASLRLRDKKISKDVTTGKDLLVKQNGIIANGLDHKENNSSGQNDKLITVMNKTDKVGIKTISAVQNKRTLDSKLSTDQSSKMNGNESGGVKLLNGVVYVDDRPSSIASASITKNCELSLIDKDKGKFESSSQSTATETIKTPKISEVLSEAQIQIKDVTSQNNSMNNKFKDLMDVDENVNDKPDSTSDLICIQANIRDAGEKIGKNDDFSCVSIVQEKTNGTLEKKKLDDSVQRNDYQTLESGKSITFTEIGQRDDGIKNYLSMDVDLNTETSQNNEDDWRDSESGSLIIDESAPKENKSNDKLNGDTEDGKTLKEGDKSGAAKNKDQNGLNNVIEEVDLIDDDSQEAILKSNNTDTNISHSVSLDTTNGDKIEESSQDGRAAVHKRRRRKKLVETMQEELLISEAESGGRQKRRSARNAEEMIRKEILKGDNDDEDSSDDVDKLVKVNYRKSLTPNIITRTLSPPTLKRTLDEVSDEKDNAASTGLKRIRPNVEDTSVSVAQKQRNEFLSPRKSQESVIATGQLMRKISQDDIRGKLKKLTQEELEALLLQKIVECITVRGEMGKLREQARASKKCQESLRNKNQQLQKQVEGFEMVLKRINYDKNSNGDKYVPPIKINRSVGLQVNFLSQEHGIQSLKQIQALRTGANSANTPKQVSAQALIPDNQSPRKMMKTRSPRRPDMTPTIVQVPTPTSVGVQANSATPALVMTAKPTDPNAKRNGNVLQIVAPSVTAIATTGGLPARLPRVLQAVPASSVALNNATNLRLLPAANSTAAMGTNVPRLAYVMQSGPNGVPTRQLVLTSNNSVKTVTSLTTTGTLNYKRSVTALPNGAVRLVTTQAAQIPISKHPAPLPESPMPPSEPSWKLAPPAPSLKISKVATGIVLSWNMSLTDKYADIVSYQLYAYQEVAGTPPSANLWKKVGDVRALPLPMACTLTQFTEGNNYYFAVRAVDAHSRFGQYSKPGNISL